MRKNTIEKTISFQQNKEPKKITTKLKILSKILANSNKIKIVNKTNKMSNSIENIKNFQNEETNINNKLNENNNYSIKPLKVTKSGYIENIIQKKNMDFLNYYLDCRIKNEKEIKKQFNPEINNNISNINIKEIEGKNLKEVIFLEEYNKKMMIKKYEDIKKLIKINNEKNLNSLLKKKSIDVNKFKNIIKSSSFDFSPISQFKKMKELSKKKLEYKISQNLKKEKGSFDSKIKRIDNSSNAYLKSLKSFKLNEINIMQLEPKQKHEIIRVQSAKNAKTFDKSESTNFNINKKFINPKVNSYHVNPNINKSSLFHEKQNKRRFSAKIKSAHFSTSAIKKNLDLDETIKSWEKNINTNSFEEII